MHSTCHGKVSRGCTGGITGAHLAEVVRRDQRPGQLIVPALHSIDKANGQASDQERRWRLTLSQTCRLRGWRLLEAHMLELSVTNGSGHHTCSGCRT